MRRTSAILTIVVVLSLVAAAQAQVQEVGGSASAPFPAAACPSRCSVIARVTGYQAQVGRIHNPFVIAQAGHSFYPCKTTVFSRFSTLDSRLNALSQTSQSVFILSRRCQLREGRVCLASF